MEWLEDSKEAREVLGNYTRGCEDIVGASLGIKCTLSDQYWLGR